MTKDASTYRSIWKAGLKVVLTIVALPLGYLLIAFLLSITPVNRNAQPLAEGIEIFIESNGVHTDFVLPIITNVIDWKTLFPASHFQNIRPDLMTHVAFGWGDQGFYLETPTWADLKASTAVKALFLKSPSAMHVTYSYHPKPAEYRKPMLISPAQYEQLVAYILDSFAKDAGQNVILIPGKGYRRNDAFYNAKGSYSMYKTCNEWTGKGLRKIGVKTGVWTPFAQSILHHL